MVDNSITKEDCPCESIQLLKSDDPGHFYIYGPASVEVIDKERDRIRASALQVSLPQLLRRGRLSLAHQDVIVGEILPETTVSGTLYKTGVFKDRLMVLGDIWDDTEAGQETRQRILSKELKSYSISGQIRKDGAARVCDEKGCYRDISKLDSHAVTICEQGMNPEAHFERLQKGDSSTMVYIPIVTSLSSVEKDASTSEAEVLKADMADNKENIKPPEPEAVSKDAPTIQAAAGGGGGGGDLAEIKGLLTKLIGMMGGGGGGDVQAAQKEAPAPAVTKEDIDKMVEARVKELIAKAPAVETPRPETDVRKETSPLEILNDPYQLRKMTPGQIEEMFPREA